MGFFVFVAGFRLMPWTIYADMSDADLAAVYVYLMA